MPKIAIGCLALLVVFICLGANPASAAPTIALFEEFTNSGCGPCGEAAPHIDSFAVADHDQCVVIRWHTSGPDASDPFYMANSADDNARSSHFNITGVPSLIMDSVDVGRTVGSLETAMHAQTDHDSPVSLMLLVDETTDSYDATAIVNTESMPPSGNWRLWVVATEDSIHFAAPNGETEFSNVARKAALIEGEPLNLRMGHSDTFRYSIPIGAAWNRDHCSIVAFVQNYDTHHFMQASYATRAFDFAVNLPHSQTESLYTASPWDMVGDIRNQGRNADTYTITFSRSVPAGWDAWYVLDGVRHTDAQTVDLPAGGSVPFEVHLTSTSTDGNATVDITITSAAAPLAVRHLTYNLHTGHYSYSLASVGVNDSTGTGVHGDRDHILDAGERVFLGMRFNFTGTINAPSMAAHLSTSDPYLNVELADATIPAAEIGRALVMDNAFLVSANISIPNTYTASLTLSLEAGSFHQDIPFEMANLNPSSSGGGVLWVDLHATGAESGTEANPYHTIMGAVNAAAPGTTIQIRAGTYNERVRIDHKPSLRLLGSAPQDVIVDANNNQRPLTILSSHVAIAKMSFKRSGTGAYQGMDNAGIVADTGSIALITNCIIQNNTGHGVNLNGKDTLRYCLVLDNQENGLILNNADAIAFNCTINHNSMNGVQMSRQGVLSNCIVSNNTLAGIAGASLNQGGYNCFNSNMFGDYDGGSARPGDFSSNPLFVGGSPFDYNLQASSPCLNTGDPSYPNDPDGSRVDIGATPYITTSSAPLPTEYAAADVLRLSLPTLVTGSDVRMEVFTSYRGPVSWEVVNMLGMRVGAVRQGFIGADRNYLTFAAPNVPGTYLLKLACNEHIVTGRFVKR